LNVLFAGGCAIEEGMPETWDWISSSAGTWSCCLSKQKWF
jgi:hypothetical protein